MYERQAGRKVKAICSDGKVRTATFTAEADTFFTVPARVSVNGLTVSGFVTGWNPIFGFPEVGVMSSPVELMFYVNLLGKNGEALPGWGKCELLPD
jgi:hypothetical protein